MEDNFSTYHPFISFMYFVVVLVFSMFFTHPAILGISLCTAIAYSIVLLGVKKSIKFDLIYMIPTLIFVIIINFAFNHYGVTILFYFKSGNPVTLESIVYGIVMAVMFFSVIVWFSCYNTIMTSDKFIYLFGRIIPAMSLILSMALRFVPKFKAQIHIISTGQKCIGRDVSNGNIIQRAKNGIKILSIMITWALENAIETADSMKARGYGLKGRTSFSLFRFDARDKSMLCTMLILLFILIIGCITGQTKAVYNPIISFNEFTSLSFITYSAFLIFCLLPIVCDYMEELKWRQLRSQI